MGKHRFIDTPSMGGASLRERASQEITEALKQNMRYKVIFILTLDSGCLREDQLNTMKLILDSAPIKKYGVLVNKLSKKVHDKFSPRSIAFEDMVQIIDQNMPNRKKMRPQHVHLVRDDSLLEDASNKVVALPEETVQFMKSLPSVHIAARKVKAIQASVWHEQIQSLEMEVNKTKARRRRVRGQMMWVAKLLLFPAFLRAASNAVRPKIALLA